MEDLEDDYIFRDITQFNGVWRPKSSLSTPGSQVDKTNSSRPVTGNSRVEYSFKRDEAESAQGKTRAVTGRFSAISAPTPAPANSRIFFIQNKRSSRTALTNRSIKNYNNNSNFVTKSDNRRSESNYGFCTMDNRQKSTDLRVSQCARTRASFPQPDRTCHTYSAYNVARDCERLAISPYGEPMLSGATGRYREKYKHKIAEKSNSRRQLRSAKLNSSHPAKIASNGEVFERYFENSIMRNILECKKSAGVLKRPPASRPRVHRSQSVDSVVSKIHQNAQKRVDAVQSTLGLNSHLATEGQRFGVEHQVALLLSARLEHHRRTSSQSEFESLEFMSVKTDLPRFQSQPVSLLTKGETSLRDGMHSNLFDEERASRGTTQFYQRRRRSRSPPLSKISRDKFLPEAMLRRQDNDVNFQSVSDLRIRKAGMTTPVSDWRSGVSESTRRPKSTLTTKMRLESVASLSREQFGDNDAVPNSNDDVIISNDDVIISNDGLKMQNNAKDNTERAGETTGDCFDGENPDPVSIEEDGDLEGKETEISNGCVKLKVDTRREETDYILRTEGEKFEQFKQTRNDSDILQDVEEVMESILRDIELNQ